MSSNSSSSNEKPSNTVLEPPAGPMTEPTTRPRTTLYAAYGANTCIDSMAMRCPAAVPVGGAVFTGWKLSFRGVADVVPKKGRELHVALWRITPACEKALDRFEGYPHHYIKRDFRMTYPDGTVETGMFYTMRAPGGLALPYESYERTLRAGYADFGMPAEQIDAAMAQAAEAEARHPHEHLIWTRKLPGAAWGRKRRKKKERAPEQTGWNI